MVRKEKFGKFVLLEELETSGLGTEYRAAKLSATGFEKLVHVLRLKPALSQHADAIRALMDQVKFAAQLHHTNLQKIHGIGKVDSAYYVSHEFLEAKSLRTVFDRTRQDSFPFSVDHTLLIASKVCAALEHAHGRRVEDGVRYFHGFITPASVLVSYEGEVRLRGFGIWPSRIREAGGATADEDAYLSPEQVSGGRGDTRSDTWAVGALLFETLTGQRFGEDRGQDPAALLASARVKDAANEDEAVPKPIADILQKALAADPAARYGEVQEMRKAVDTLLFSGDFSPTTFNLAFFMHSLFRQDIDREAQALQEEREGSYLEFLGEEPARATPAPRPAAPLPAPPLPAAPVPAPPRIGEVPPPAVAAADAPTRRSSSLAAALVPPPAAAPSRPEPPAISAQQAASGFTFHRSEPAATRSRAPLAIVGTAALLLIGAGAAYVSLRGRPEPAAAAAAASPTTLSAQAAAAMARVKELEERLQAIEAEKAVAEARAAEEARKRVETQAAARGQMADTAAVARAQDEARRRAQAAQDRRVREEQEKLESEQRAAEARLAEERREAEDRAAADQVVVTTTTTTTLPPPTPEPAPALRAGTLVNLSDPGVIAPVLDRAPVAEYPPIALRQRLEGTVELSVLVDERGSVIETQVVAGAGGRSGLNEAAVESVKRRKYRPGIKDGVPIKVWIPVRVQFRLPR